MDLFKNRTLLGYSRQLVHVRDEVQKVEYVAFNKLLMGDWDCPDDFHFHEGSVTVPSREYVLGILQRDVRERPDHAWRVYQTPGGVRAFLSSHFEEFSPDRHRLLMSDLSIDPVYCEITTDQRAWWCRVSPKVGRPGDFVARLWITLKGADAIESLDALLALGEHDRLCQRTFPFYHRVEVSCPTCSLGNSYFHGACDFCNRTGRRVLAIGPEELPFLLAIETDPLDDSPRLIWSDYLLDTGQDDQLIEAVRQLPSSAIRIVRPCKPEPTPVSAEDREAHAELPF